MSMATRSLHVALLAVFAGGSAACGLLDSSATGDVRVTMQQSDAALSPAMSGWFASVAGVDGAAAAISKDAVQSLTITVNEIQFLPKAAEAQAADEGVWISLVVDATFDLMALPTTDGSPLVIATGSLDVGNYGDVRLFVASAQIVFKQDVSLGVSLNTFTAGEPGYPVDLPSGPETGIKTDAEFTVEADTDVSLLFSPSATFLNVTGTGDGHVILAPVIRSKPDGA
ncbi:MAG: DUF4382 domain-containing protein [Gemmatimonadetes bacterium]|nr:DUF4382 domain-containing protein [Gemmatimonadota bacterium]